MAKFLKGISKVNYSEDREKVSPITGTRTFPITADENQWLPASVIAYIFGCSKQTIRLLYLSKKVRCVLYPNAPMLFNIADVHKLYRDQLVKTTPIINNVHTWNNENEQ